MKHLEYDPDILEEFIRANCHWPGKYPNALQTADVKSPYPVNRILEYLFDTPFIPQAIEVFKIFGKNSFVSGQEIYTSWECKIDSPKFVANECRVSEAWSPDTFYLDFLNLREVVDNDLIDTPVFIEWVRRLLGVDAFRYQDGKWETCLVQK